MSGPEAAGPAPGSEPTEEQLRAAYEAELSRIDATDMIAQAAVSLLNIGARRIAPAPEGAAASGAGRDLEQARDAIDAARALLAILERRIPGELGPLRDALSRLQLAYAAEVGAAEPDAPQQPETPAGPPGGQGDPGAGTEPGAGPGEQPRPGPAEASGRLWVPGR